MSDTATINQSREDRLVELVDAAQRELTVAAALETLARAIYDIPVPVAHYAPVWEAVARRLIRDAQESRLRARRASEHIIDVQSAIDAHERWTPTR